MLTSALIVCRNEEIDLADRRVDWEVSGNRIVRIEAHRSRKGRKVSAWLDELESDPDFSRHVAAARRDISVWDRDGGTRFRAMRLHAGFSQRQLADTIDTTQANISRIESGDQLPSFDTAVKLARALRVSLDHLAGAVGLA